MIKLFLIILLSISSKVFAINVTIIDTATDEWLNKPYASLWCYSDSAMTEVIKRQFSKFDPPYPRLATLDPKIASVTAFCGGTTTTFAVTLGAKGMEPKFICDKYLKNATLDSKLTLYIAQSKTEEILCSDKKI